jgi:hypothetical protein
MDQEVTRYNMAYFAKIDSNNIVQEVVSINNNELLQNGVENETKGINFCKSLFGQDTNWVQTSYNTKAGKHYLSDGVTLSQTQEKALRKNYANIGYIYNSQIDGFTPPQPIDPSLVLNTSTGLWEPPTQSPGEEYYWREDINGGNWDLKTNISN